MSSNVIIVKLSYCTVEPVATVKTLEFIEETTGAIFTVKIHICCDNSLLTCYQYVAERMTSHHIVEQSDGPGRASLNYQESEETKSASRKTHSIAPRARTKSTSISVSTEIISFTSSSSPHSSSFPVTLLSHEQMAGRAPSSIDAFGNLQADLVGSLEKWFGAFGWSSGPFPVSIPQTIRSLTSRAVGKTRGTGRILAGTRSQMVTVYDMIVNLSGRTIPGFPAGQLLPENHEERRAQLLWQYGVILEVIKAQGGMVAHINPEDLLELDESLSRSEKLDFEKRSHKAWTDFLLQVFRVFSLAKVEKFLPGVDASHIESNIYDKSEKVILSWINDVFEQTRGALFGLERRTIINFDNDLRDGLVLGSLVAFYCPHFKEDVQKMFVSCTMAEQCLHNALILLEIFKKIRIEMIPLATQITDPNPITMLMLLVNLAEVLPSLKPIDIAYLNGKLSQTCKKTFTIKNKFKKAVQYEAFIISKNPELFRTSVEKFSIQAKSSFQLAVSFNSALFLKTEALLVVKSLPTPAFPVPAETLVFTLKANISEFSPKSANIDLRCPVYEEKQIQVPVACPFAFQGTKEFTISTLESHKISKSAYHIDEILEEMENNVFPREFYAVDEKVTLDGSKTEQIIAILYNPIGQIQKSGIFILSNEEVGQFAIKISGTPEPPTPSPILRGQGSCCTVSGSQLFWKTTVSGSKKTLLKIYGENVSFQNALERVVKLSLPRAEREIREKTSSLNSRALQEKVISPLFYKKKRTFEVFSTSEHFILPKTIEIDTSTAQVEIPIELATNEQGRYPGLIFFQGTGDSILDTRIIQLEAIVTAEFRSKSLTLEAPAREQVDQLIPIQNTTPHVWNMTANLRIEENTDGFWQARDPFSGPENFVVPPGDTFNYRLLFSPTFKKTYKAVLTIVNNTDGSTVEFAITGVGRNPKISQKLTFNAVKCDSPRKASIIIPNLGRRKMQFQVHTTLGSVIAGPLSITAEKSSSAEYIFEIVPPEIDHYRGLLVFAGRELYKTNNPDYDSDNEDDFYGENGDELVEMPHGEEFLLLYELEITSVRGDPAKRLKFSGSCGQLLSKKIELNNPTERDLIFKIKSSNQEILKVEEAVKIPPHSKKPIKILFMPEAASNPTPADLTFESDLTGRFWYQIEFYLEEPLPKIVVAKDVPFGKWENISVPGSEDLFAPKETKEINLFFIPHQLGKTVSTFTATSIDCGKTIYDIEGNALPPKNFETTKIFAKANSQNGKTMIIPFRNPSHKSILCSVDLKMSGEEKDSESLQILLKKNLPIFLEKGEMLEIPVSFISGGESDRVTSAFVTVTARFKDKSFWTKLNEDEQIHEGYTVDSNRNVEAISFVYPVCGSTLFDIPEEKQLLIECAARSRYERKIELSLNGAAPNILPTVAHRTKSAQNASGFSFDLLFAENSSFSSAISLSLDAKTVDKETGEVKLVFGVTFMPMIGGINEKAVLSISSAIGSTWRFPLELRVSDPPADDEICIPGCKIGSRSVVRFRLFGDNIAFSAKLLENVEKEAALLEISPEEGVLTPDGLEFTITYTPRVFGEKASARLLVLTSDKTFTYDITTVPAAPRRNLMRSSAYGKIYERPKRELKNYVQQNKLMTKKKNIPLKLDAL